MKEKIRMQILFYTTDDADKRRCEEDINFGCKYN